MMEVALVVPAYKPTKDMLPMLERFARETDLTLLVVDDGSGESYQSLFAQVPEKTILLRHEQNRGKGAALKTAMRYILDNLPECNFAVTADADGQHAFEDILKVVKSAQAHPGALVLGGRAFEGDVPLRSRLGNAITRQVFAAASGASVHDTQTGLRSFDRDAMQKFVEIPGERYEYEINMLLYAARNGISILEERIQTVYIDDNSSSHFNPFRDSIKIYSCIFKYAGSSLVAALVDFLVWLLMLKWVTAGMADRDLALLISVVVARLVSAPVNFVINKTLVFQSKREWKRELVKYAVLCICSLTVNFYMLKLLINVLHWYETLAKILVETVLFCANFVIQGRLVYKRQG